MDPKERRVKIHRAEMESLINLKSKLDHQEVVSSFAEKYQKLGWVLQVVNPQDATVLNVDAGEDPETWVNRLWEPGLSGPGALPSWKFEANLTPADHRSRKEE